MYKMFQCEICRQIYSQENDVNAEENCRQCEAQTETSSLPLQSLCLFEDIKVRITRSEMTGFGDHNYIYRISMNKRDNPKKTLVYRPGWYKHDELTLLEEKNSNVV